VVKPLAGIEMNPVAVDSALVCWSGKYVAFQRAPAICGKARPAGARPSGAGLKHHRGVAALANTGGIARGRRLALTLQARSETQRIYRTAH